MSAQLKINTFALVTSLAKVVDIMSPAVGNHHLQVSYLVYRIGDELGLTENEKYDLTVAGALHDIGAFSLQDRLDLLEFEDTHPGEHSRAGYLLLKDFKPFLPAAEIIKFHHLPWDDGGGAFQGSEPVPPASHIIHLADRIAVQISREKPILGQVPGICEAIVRQKSSMFVPAQVEAMVALAQKDYVWLEVTSDFIGAILRKNTSENEKILDLEEMSAFSRLICRLIDFKSDFTSTHSSGVAAIAVALAELNKFSSQECQLIEIAAYLHDLGKLAIPSEILEKRDKLTDDEWFVMRSHVYYTHQVLESIDMLEMVNSWGSLHQERLNGSGYPFGYKGDQLSVGSRIMAIADIFTALTEDRPYRKGMSKNDVNNALLSMVDREELDKDIVSIVFENYDRLNDIRMSSQKKAKFEYREFQSSLRNEITDKAGN